MAESFIIVTPPTSEPISLVEAKTFCRVDFPDEDLLIQQLITDARLYGEDITKHGCAPQTIQAIIEPDLVASGPLSGPVIGPIDAWMMAERPTVPLFGYAAMRLKLPMSPVQSITTLEFQLTRMDQPEWLPIPALDANGNPNWRLDVVASPSELNIFSILAASRYRITYQAGYPSLPQALRRAMLNLISYWYNHREGQALPPDLQGQFLQRKVWQL